MSGFPEQCGCGCGVDVTPGRRYRPGHNHRQPKTYVVDEASGCWLWQGATDLAGYGRTRANGKGQAAHRWFYEQAKGPIAHGLVIDHLCRNPPCVNPDHLEPVTVAQNTQRGAGARLSWEVVREIRASGLACTSAARRFGISEMQAWRVLTQKTWKESVLGP